MQVVSKFPFGLKLSTDNDTSDLCRHIYIDFSFCRLFEITLLKKFRRLFPGELFMLFAEIRTENSTPGIFKRRGLKTT